MSSSSWCEKTSSNIHEVAIKKFSTITSDIRNIPNIMYLRPCLTQEKCQVFGIVQTFPFLLVAIQSNKFGEAQVIS